MSRLDPVADDQMDNVVDWEMARALYADSFSYPVDKATEWMKLINGPDWIKAQGFKRQARKCREALYGRNLKIINDSNDAAIRGGNRVDSSPTDCKSVSCESGGASPSLPTTLPGGE